MKRFIGLSLSVALALSGCKKESPPQEAKPAQEEAAEQAAPAPAAAPKPEAPAAEEKKPQITEELVAKFVTYSKTRRDDLKTALPKLREQGKALKNKPGIDGALEFKKNAEQFQKEQEELNKKELAQQGLTEETAKYLHDAATEVYMARKGAEGMAKAMPPAAELQAKVAGAPPEQQAELKKQVEDMQKQVEQMKTAAEARKTYGDAAVDAFIKHEAELAPVLEEQMKLGFDAIGAAGGQ